LFVATPSPDPLAAGQAGNEASRPALPHSTRTSLTTKQLPCHHPSFPTLTTSPPMTGAAGPGARSYWRSESRGYQGAAPGIGAAPSQVAGRGSRAAASQGRKGFGGAKHDRGECRVGIGLRGAAQAGCRQAPCRPPGPETQRPGGLHGAGIPPSSREAAQGFPTPPPRPV
jgi:hypothetical protein